MTSVKHNFLKPRRAGGVWTPPHGFCRYLTNGGAERRRFWHSQFIHLFRTLCENFRPRSLKVRSPGHDKWPHLRKFWMHLIATPNDRSPENVQPLISVNRNVKCISWNFDIGDLRSDQFCDLSIISSLDENHSKRSQTSGLTRAPLWYSAERAPRGGGRFCPLSNSWTDGRKRREKRKTKALNKTNLKNTKNFN